MAHMIDMTAARANMAYVGDRPWHGLGSKLPEGADLETWTKAAGLDWEALVIPSQYLFNGTLREAPDNFHMVRSDSGESLSVMTSRYTPHQPSEVMAFFRDFILTDDRFALETAGSLKGGRVIWALAKYATPLTVAGDDHVAYVLLTTSFNGSLATTAQATMIRVVCNNTLTASVYSRNAASVKVPHYKDFAKAHVKSDAAARLATVAAGFVQYKAMGEALASMRITADQMEALFKGLTLKGPQASTGKPSSKAVGQLEQVLSAYRTTLAEGATGGWAVLNAVTRYVDHERYTRNNHGGAGGSTGEARLASAWLGSGAVMKRDAVAALAKIGNLTPEALARAYIANGGNPADLDGLGDTTAARLDALAIV